MCEIRIIIINYIIWTSAYVKSNINNINKIYKHKHKAAAPNLNLSRACARADKIFVYVVCLCVYVLWAVSNERERAAVQQIKFKNLVSVAEWFPLCIQINKWTQLCAVRERASQSWRRPHLFVIKQNVQHNCVLLTPAHWLRCRKVFYFVLFYITRKLHPCSYKDLRAHQKMYTTYINKSHTYVENKTLCCIIIVPRSWDMRCRRRRRRRNLRGTSHVR